MCTVLRRTLTFMLAIFSLSIASLPFILPFAFDATGTTWAQVLPALGVFYGVYVMLPWFVLALLFNIVREWRIAAAAKRQDQKKPA